LAAVAAAVIVVELCRIAPAHDYTVAVAYR